MKIAAFNVKNFGEKKVNNGAVRRNLIRIVSRYSVLVMLEVVDQSGEVMEKFCKELNEQNGGHEYAMECSKPLGRNSYKEKFVFFYRKDEVKMMKTPYQYQENKDEDVLAREPFIVQFTCPNTVVQTLVLIPVHTKPVDAKRELDVLDDVVEDVRRKWRTDNIMILGDFNADGRYLTKREKKKISICSAPYHWLIEDDVDTTASNCNDHTYDRIMVYGDEVLQAIVPGSAKAFNFQEEFNLTDKEALSISDHYPVEVELELKASKKGP